MSIHPTAIVDPAAHISESADIGPYCIIGPHVEIEADCELHGHVIVQGHTHIGRGNRIFHHSAIGNPPQDIKYAGEPTAVEIGEGNIIREFVTVNCGTIHGGGTTRIGSGCFIMAYCHIAHDCVLENNVIMANCATLAGHVHIAERVNFGGLAAVHQFARIGRLAFIGGGAMVRRDVPPFVIARGDRARIVGLNRVGLERNGFSPDRIEKIEYIYRLLWKNDCDSGIPELEQDFASDEDAQEIFAFIKGTRIGISPPRED